MEGRERERNKERERETKRKKECDMERERHDGGKKNSRFGMDGSKSCCTFYSHLAVRQLVREKNEDGERERGENKDEKWRRGGEEKSWGIPPARPLLASFFISLDPPFSTLLIFRSMSQIHPSEISSCLSLISRPTLVGIVITIQHFLCSFSPFLSRTLSLFLSISLSHSVSLSLHFSLALCLSFSPFFSSLLLVSSLWYVCFVPVHFVCRLILYLQLLLGNESYKKGRTQTLTDEPIKMSVSIEY